MCRRVACPNDGRPGWYGCGAHIEAALDGVPEADRCTCEHERDARGFYAIKETKADLAKATVAIGEARDSATS